MLKLLITNKGVYNGHQAIQKLADSIQDYVDLGYQCGGHDGRSVCVPAADDRDAHLE
jgi:hypothetical protein